MNQYFKSIIDQDACSVVVCNIEHTIIYMNPAADANYKKRGGRELVGKSILECHNPHSVERIKQVIAWFAKDKNNNKVHTFFNEKQNKDVYMIALRDEEGNFIGYYEKHEYRTKDETPFYGMA